MAEHILIIHQGALGDVVLSFPALLALKRERGARLSLLASNQIAQVACGLGIVDAHFRAESARFCGLFAQDLNHEMTTFVSAFDRIVVLGLSRTLERTIGRRYYGQVSTIASRPPAGRQTHVAAHIVRQMEATGLLTDGYGIRVARSFLRGSPEPDDVIRTCIGGLSMQQADDYHECRQPEKDLFVIHPGAGSVRKRWGLNRFIALADVIEQSTSADTVFLIGPAEKDLLPLLRQVAVGRRTHVYQLDDLCKLVGFMTGIRCFVGNDSGLGHLAGFLGVPTTAIFGPSSTNRWAPLGRAVKILRGTRDCPPCFETETHNCEDPRCLDGVSVGMVVGAMEALDVI